MQSRVHALGKVLVKFSTVSASLAVFCNHKFCSDLVTAYEPCQDAKCRCHGEIATCLFGDHIVEGNDGTVIRGSWEKVDRVCMLSTVETFQ